MHKQASVNAALAFSLLPLEQNIWWCSASLKSLHSASFIDVPLSCSTFPSMSLNYNQLYCQSQVKKAEIWVFWREFNIGNSIYKWWKSGKAKQISNIWELLRLRGQSSRGWGWSLEMGTTWQKPVPERRKIYNQRHRPRWREKGKSTMASTLFPQSSRSFHWPKRSCIKPEARNLRMEFPEIADKSRGEAGDGRDSKQEHNPCLWALEVKLWHTKCCPLLTQAPSQTSSESHRQQALDN